MRACAPPPCQGQLSEARQEPESPAPCAPAAPTSVNTAVGHVLDGVENEIRLHSAPHEWQLSTTDSQIPKHSPHEDTADAAAVAGADSGRGPAAGQHDSSLDNRLMACQTAEQCYGRQPSASVTCEAHEVRRKVLTPPFQDVFLYLLFGFLGTASARLLVGGNCKFLPRAWIRLMALGIYVVQGLL